MKCLVMQGRRERAQKPIASAPPSLHPRSLSPGLVLPALPHSWRFSALPRGPESQSPSSPTETPTLPGKPLSRVPTLGMGRAEVVSLEILPEQGGRESDPKLQTPQSCNAEYCLEIGVRSHRPKGFSVKGDGQLGEAASQDRQEWALRASPPGLGTAHISIWGLGASASSKDRTEMTPFRFINPFKNRALGPPDRAIWFPYLPYLPALTFHLECLSQDNDQIPLRVIEWGPLPSIFPTISNEWKMQSSKK